MATKQMSLPDATSHLLHLNGIEPSFGFVSKLDGQLFHRRDKVWLLENFTRQRAHHLRTIDEWGAVMGRGVLRSGISVVISQFQYLPPLAKQSMAIKNDGLSIRPTLFA